MKTELVRNAAIASMFAILYVALYHLSGLLSGNQQVGGIASLLFLPAFIRLLGFLMVGFWIVPALFAASCWIVMTGAYQIGAGYTADLLLAASTAIGGPLGVAIAARLCGLKPDLENLSPLCLLVLSFACSAGNALFHHASLRISGIVDGISPATFGIFVGDMLGTWAIIYAIKIAISFVRPLLKR